MEVSLFELFAIFFYIGLFTIGGGLVAITLMQQTLVERGLISADTFYNMVAVSESTPGPIGINMATYVGHNFYGPVGAIVTTFGQVLPSLITILIIAHFLRKFREARSVQTVFTVLRPASSGLILVATFNIFILALVNIPESFSMLKEISTWKSIIYIPSFIFYIAMLILLKKFKAHPIIVILLGAVFGIFNG